MKKDWGAGPRAESFSEPRLMLASSRVGLLAHFWGTLLYPRHLGLPPHVDYYSIIRGLRITLRLVLAPCRVGPLARLEEDYYSGRAITVIIGSN